MTTFDWSIFNPLTHEKFVSQFGKGESPVDKYFTWWNEYYRHHAYHFYIAQYEWHELLVFREFSRSHHLHICYPSELSSVDHDGVYLIKWEEWKLNSKSLMDHQENIKPLLEDQENHNFRMYTATDIDDDFIGMIHENFFPDILHQAKALWFEVNTNKNSREEIRYLRSIPYTEYLMTKHWKRVRSAMILIEQAMCRDCYSAEPLYGGDWETDINIHHVSYESLGFERYDHLCLLCKYHHKLIHSSV